MCEWKLFLTLNHGLQDSLRKRGEGLWHSGRTLLGNTSSHWFSLRASLLDGGSAAESFSEFALVSLLAGYHWFINLTFTFFFFCCCFLFYVSIIRCSSGWRNTVCGDSLYKGKGCVTESRIFELSVIKMNALFVKEIVTNITSLFQSNYIRYFFSSISVGQCSGLSGQTSGGTCCVKQVR